VRRQFGSGFGLCLAEVSSGYLPAMKNRTLVIRAVVALLVGVRGVVTVSGLFDGLWCRLPEGKVDHE